MNQGVLAVVLALGAVGCKNSAPQKSAKPVDAAAAPKPVDAAAATAARDPVEVGKTFYLHLANGELDAALAQYDPALQAKIKPSEIADVWKAIGAPGAPASVDALALTDDGSFVRVEAHYPGGAIAGLILGLKDGWLHRVMVKPYWTPPAYVDASKFTVERVTVGSGKTALHGELCLPVGAAAPQPVVILVQGSGSGDLDEWAAPEAQFLFRDIGYGLASQGVATLRFDKASSLPAFIGAGYDPQTFTVQNEYLDPVTWALAFVAGRADLDPKRVFVLGHSEGGWLVPWFLKDHPALAGAIIASGNARHFAELPIDQDQYLIVVNHPDRQFTKEELAALKADDEAKAKKAQDPSIADDTPPTELPFGAPAPGWKFMATYDAPGTLAKLDAPVLVLQGDRDYNVRATLDLPLWKQALAGHADATFKEYPDLNHGYLEGKGMGTPSELTLPGHVAAPVVADVAAWVTAHTGS
jgi:pimeloyl-ACP methyl ester carboxylesterase